MTLAWVEIDEDLLAETMRFSGADSADEAVNLALAAFIVEATREEAAKLSRG